MNRIFINVSDLQILTGTTDRNCRKILKRVKDQFGKLSHQHVTFEEYADYEGIKPEAIYSALKLCRN